MLWRLLALGFLAVVTVGTVIVVNSYSGTTSAVVLGALVSIIGLKVLRKSMFGMWDSLDDR